MRSIALMNQKGGVGKTSTAVNLGAALAETGKRVLLADMDPQANLTGWLLGPASEGLEDTLADALVGEVGLEDVIVRTGLPDLDLLPASLRLCGVEKYLASEIGAETVLRHAIDRAQLSPDPHDTSFDLYDYLLIDCPPSVGMLSINAMAAVMEILIPVQAQVLALNGLAQVRQVIGKIRTRLNPGLRVAGILLVMVNGRTRLSREVEASARRHFGDLVLETTIRESVKIAECPGHGKPIHRYAPSSRATREYRRLAAELVAQERESPAIPWTVAPTPSPSFQDGRPAVPPWQTDAPRSTLPPAVRERLR